MSVRAGWPLVVLVLAAAGVVLPDLFDLDAFKLGVVALLAAAVLLPRLLWRGRAALAAWLGSGGAVLYLASVAWSLPQALGALGHSAVTDRLLSAVLACVAGALGVGAARHARSALRVALLLVGVVSAVVATLQAVGLEHWLTTGPDEIVALMGNSTRAGALLALCVTAAFAAVLCPDPSEPSWRLRLAAWALTLCSAALLLTRARGGWLAAACGLVAVALVSRPRLVAQRKTWIAHLIFGVGLALVLGDGPSRLLTSKLDSDSPLLSARDVTGQVRLSIWRGTLAMSSEHPLAGWGLGRFREQYPPFRDPAEAALPGLAGSQTEVDHPHQEFLLALAEGGWPAAVCLLAFAATTLLRAARAAVGAWPAPRDERGVERADDGGCGDRVALGVLVAGTVAALVQNAWVSPGTAIPVFAAAGWAWAPSALREPSRRASILLGAGVLAAMAALLVLALPRVRVQLGMRDFLLHAEPGKLTPENFALLVHAADTDPGDLDAQRLLLSFGAEILEQQPQAPASVRDPVERARQRIADLAPHAP
jgi:O-antigen ligase